MGWMSFSSHAYLTKSAPDSRLSTGATRMRSARAWADGLSHGLTVMPVRRVNSAMIGSRRLNVAPTTFNSLLWAKADPRVPSAMAPAASAPPFKRFRRVVVISVSPSSADRPSRARDSPASHEPDQRQRRAHRQQRDHRRGRPQRVQGRLELAVELSIDHQGQGLLGAGGEEAPRELVERQREAEECRADHTG